MTVFTTHYIKSKKANLVVYSISFLVFISQPKLRTCLPPMMSKRNRWKFDCPVVSAHRSTWSHLHCLKAHWQVIHTPYAFIYLLAINFVYCLYFLLRLFLSLSLSLSLSLTHTHTHTLSSPATIVHMPFFYSDDIKHELLPQLAFLHTFIYCHQHAGRDKQFMNLKK